MTPITRSPRGKGGHSLVELLMAATFLTVGVAGTLVVHTAARRLTRTAAETRAVSVVLADVIEEMKLLTPDEIATDFPEGVPIDVGTSGLKDLAVVPDYGTFVAGQSTIDLSLTATWSTNNGGERSLTFLCAN